MVSKNEVKYIQSLYHKKNRAQHGVFIAEGVKIVGELLQSAFHIEKLYATAGWLQQNAVQVPVTEVSDDEMKKLSNLVTPQAVLAVVRMPASDTDDLPTGEWTIGLDGLQDPGNLGAIVRIADWFGIRHIVASDDTVDVYNPKVIQATMASFCRVRVHYTHLESFLARKPFPVYGALLEGRSLYDCGPLPPGMILVGSEGNGIREQIRPLIDTPLTIPRRGGAESLNAAIAAGIMVSHLLKP